MQAMVSTSLNWLNKFTWFLIFPKVDWILSVGHRLLTPAASGQSKLVSSAWTWWREPASWGPSVCHPERSTGSRWPHGGTRRSARSRGHGSCRGSAARHTAPGWTTSPAEGFATRSNLNEAKRRVIKANDLLCLQTSASIPGQDTGYSEVRKRTWPPLVASRL